MRSDISQLPKYPNNLGKIIERHHWKLSKIAENTGIPLRTLGDYRAGRTAIPQDRLEALAKCLKYPATYLVPPFREAYLLQNQDEQAKDAQALAALQAHCKKHPTDENALRELMVLLALHGHYDEIEQRYRRLVKELEQYTRRGPDPSTTDLFEDLCSQKALVFPSLAPEHVELPLPTDTAVSPETAEVQEPFALSESDEAPSPVQPTHTRVERMGDTVFLTIAIPSSDFQTQGLEGHNKQETTAVPFTLQPPFSSPSLSVSFQGIIRGEENAQKSSIKNLRDSYLALSKDIIPSLQAYGTACQGELPIGRQQIDIYEIIEQRNTMQDEQSQLIASSQITRRDLFTLASVSFPLLTNIRHGQFTAGIVEEFLSEATASVTTCWYLLQRSDGLPFVELTLPQYLPELVEVVKFSSLYRQRAAYLTAQGFLLHNLIALHRLRFAERVTYGKKAVEYARESGNLTLLIASLYLLGKAFVYNGQLAEALDTLLQAERSSQSAEVQGFLRHSVLSALGRPYAKQGKSQEVIRSLGEAHTILRDGDDEIPVYLLADYGLCQTILDEGLSTIDLGNHAKNQGSPSRAQKYWEDAAEKFGKIEQLPSGIVVPARMDAEIKIGRALAYAKAGHMEEFIKAFTRGVKLAKELGSNKRLQEAREALKAALERWPHEQRILNLWELLF